MTLNKKGKFPDLDILDSSSLNKRHAYRQQVKRLTKKICTEYLGHLLSRRNLIKIRNLSKLVILYCFSAQNQEVEWPLAKVMELYPSKMEVSDW
ncbi:hypothetical protein TNIN_387311 [Trichonephila inaurata madagascariensis]|uniref:Uncharacterized protein n=1 Tax=Trichonephila inaurata madagascariensis TaxID=2747483 RepID=A0A8X6YGC3_9ARAC|nr:hypothetical protein TNIN_387311 [Trichonephila inaurata madagascariensis]